MTKEELREYRTIKTELSELEALARKIERHGNQELREQYSERRARLSDKLLHIEQALETLDYTERTLMRLRYIDGLSWQAVSLRINYSWQQTHRIHARALVKLKGEERDGRKGRR